MMAGLPLAITRIAAADGSPETTARPPTSTSVLGQLPYWDDGLSEVSYYKAVDIIYGKPRSYVRVHMVNRQWMDPTTGVKSSKPDAESLPVLKLIISEEIPTENYSYRYLTTIFARRSDLAPFKMALSS